MTHDKAIEILSDLKKWLEMTNHTSNGVTINDEVFDALDIAIDCVDRTDEEPTLAISYMVRDLKTAGISFDTIVYDKNLVMLSYPDRKFPVFEILEIDGEEKFVKVSKYDDVGNVVTLDKVKWVDAFDAIFHHFRTIHGF